MTSAGLFMIRTTRSASAARSHGPSQRYLGQPGIHRPQLYSRPSAIERKAATSLVERKGRAVSTTEHARRAARLASAPTAYATKMAGRLPQAEVNLNWSLQPDSSQAGAPQDKTGTNSDRQLCTQTEASMVQSVFHAFADR